MNQHRPVTTDATRSRVPTVLLVPAFVLVALVGALLPSFSAGATLLVAAVGAALLGLCAADRLPRGPVPGRLGVRAAWWALPVLLLGVVELIDFVLGSTYAHPTLSVLADPVLAGYAPRAVTWFAWQLVFFGLARR